MVTDKAQKHLGISTGNAKNKPIACCVGCISPLSKRTLHSENAFNRYEPQFLNYILSRLDDSGFNNYNKTLNVQEEQIDENGKIIKDRYDLLISRNKNYLLVEIDETNPHWDNAKDFREDRKRETRFLNKYDGSIIRLRVGDEGKKIVSCVAKKNGYCHVIDKRLFENNMDIVTNHIIQVFNGPKSIKHAYIDFSSDLGIRDFKQVFDQTPSKNYVYDRRPDKEYNPMKKDIMENLIQKVHHINIKEPARCTHEDGRGRCKQDISGKSKFCAKHKI